MGNVESFMFLVKLKDIRIWKGYFIVKYRIEIMELLVFKGRLSFNVIKIMGIKFVRCNRNIYFKDDFKINVGRGC